MKGVAGFGIIRDAPIAFHPLTLGAKSVEDSRLPEDIHLLPCI